MTYKEKVIDLLKRMMADTKKKRDYLERYECSEDVKRLDGGLNFANNFLAALTSIKEDPVPERIGNEPEDFVVEGKTIIVNEPPVDDQPQFNLDVDESNVFTEPAESEDERIRKWLLEYFYLHRDDLRGASVSDMDILNYLERQKEQKSVEDKDLSKCSEDIQEFMEIFCEDQPKAYWDGVADTLEWIKEHPNNQFMQKPTERVEINKSLSDAVIAELDKYNGENYWKSPWLIDSTGLHYPLYFAKLGATWQKEQKSAEWNRGDEQNLNVCLSYIKDESLRNWLIDAIHVRYDKPAWSEEEKDFMDTLIARIFGSPNITTILAPDDCYGFKKALTEIRNKMDLQYSGDERQAIKKHIDSLRSQSKPAEWSEEDKLTIDAAIYWLERRLRIEKVSDKSTGCSPLSMRKTAERLKSLRPQSKPAEWSEKDKHILKNIHDFVKENTGNPHRVNCAEECLNWLKSLPKRFNLQPQQGWSEEDEKIAYTILNLLCSQVTYVTGQGTTSGRQYPTYAKERDWFENRLKSLRPSWKPSEEQMEVLRKYVMGEWKGLTFKEDEHLKSLLIDLENYSHDNR